MKPVEVAEPEPPKTFSLFDTPTAPAPIAEHVDGEEEILAEVSGSDDEEEDEDFDQAA
jgi:hypothetical protein